DLAAQSFYDREGGLETTLPTTLGSQGIGVVEKLGPGVASVKVDDRVNFYARSYATHALVPADRLIPVPDDISLEVAAAGLSQGFIAYELTHAAYPVQSGDWCLVQAAAGGIGLLLCQMAKLRGARVIGVTSTAEKGQAAQEAGADEIILSNQ